MLRALRVSRLTICPLGQPEKAIGLEPQIELWLAFLLPPYCLSHRKPKASSRQQHESAKKENPKNRSTLHGLESRAKIFAPSSRRGIFSLDSPLYRTWLLCCLPPLGRESASCSIGFSKLNSPAHRYLCLRFKLHLAMSPARLEARMDSLLSFPVGLFHPLQHAGLSRRSPSCPSSWKNSRNPCSTTLFFGEASDAIFCIPMI